MGNVQAKYSFDPNKLRDQIVCVKEMTLAEASEKMGYAPNSLSTAIKRGTMTGIMANAMKNILGITLEEIRPDPEPEPTPEPEQMTIEEALQMKVEPIPEFLIPSVENELINKLTEIVDVLKASRKTVSEETIGHGVQFGLEMFWRDHKSELKDFILKNIKGAIFSGNLEALKKHNELLNEQFDSMLMQPEKY